ncbi:MAG: FG-GAP-like repeat-containing protein [Planctomycetota bacterium]|nr:FG-GAP-like repeat-containing protein [Planctomycetota bacterium]
MYVLLINQFIPTGTLSFTDESVARLGTRLSNAKAVITGDVNGDGWIDAVVCNAWDTDVPFLYINQGAANPGFFSMESATRGLTTLLSSGGGQFGDLDDDGDLDLVLNDAYLGTANRRPRVYFNDGVGNFTFNAAAMSAAPTKGSQMDTQLVDIDGDWDLDFVGLCRAANGGTNHYLLLNNGAGTFATTAVTIPSNSASTYEGEVGDLDGDNDIDLFLVSSSSFAEGAIRNNLAPSGTLSFTALAATTDNNDDNEICLLDYDVDGDYDAVVGSLSNTREVIWINNGASVFTNAGAGVITAVSDPTLDATVGDLDNDGRYEIITAQGESAPAAWANKVYKNTGAVDTLKPIVTAVNAPTTAPKTGPWKLRAKTKDQVLDDGVDYLKATAHYVVRTSAPVLHDVAISSGGLSAPAVTMAAGDALYFTNNLGAAQVVQLTTAPRDASVVVPAGQTARLHVVQPGTYAYSVSPGGFVGSVTVTGTDSVATGLHAGVQMQRFSLSDTAAGTGRAIVYELHVTDAAGNTRVTNATRIELVDCGVATYCTARINSSGCTPSIATSGTASLTAGSGFTVSVSQVLNQKSGLLFYSLTGAAAQPFEGGFMCVAAPRFRTPVTSSGGSTTGIDCSGVLSLDFNTYISNTPGRFAFGDTVWAQFWSRDPAATFQTNLSNAVRFGLCQ